MPRVLLVQVARADANGRVPRPGRLWFHGLTLPYLAALFTPRCEVTLVDELIDPVPLDEPFDLVALTFMGVALPRAMDYADAFRERGRKVIAGGPTATLYREAVEPHVDSLVLGDADGLVDRILDDLARDRLAPVYQHPSPPSLEHCPLPRYDLVLERRGPYYPVEASRGCTLGCHFCGSPEFNRGTFRTKPLHLVRRDLENLRSLGISRVLFVDDNPTLDRTHFRGLLDLLGEMDLRWTANAPFHLLRDEALLDRMAEAGCESLSIGFETLDRRNLAEVGKGQLDPREYAEGIRRLRQRGIQTVAMFVLGLDHDQPAVFEETLAFLEEQRVEMALFHVLAPIRGTPVHQRLESSGRLLGASFEEQGPGRAGFAPAGMDRDQLDAGFWDLNERFYSMGSILRRLVLVRPDRYYFQRLPMVLANLYLRHLVRHRQLFI